MNVYICKGLEKPFFVNIGILSVYSREGTFINEE